MAEIRLNFAEQRPGNTSRNSQLPTGIQLPRQDVREASAATDALGQQIGQAANLLEVERRSMEASAAGNARVQLTRRLGELEVEFQGQDIRDSTAAGQQFRERGTAIAQELGQTIISRDGQARWQVDSGALIEPRAFNASRDAFTRNAQGMVTSLRDNLREWGVQAAGARNPEERATYIQQGEQAIAEAVAAGYINPQQQGALRQGFEADVSVARIGNTITRNPAQALAMLRDPEQTRGLDATQIQSLVARAEARSDRLAAQAEAGLARRERAVAVELGQFNTLLAGGVVPEDRLARVTQMARGTIYEAQIPQMVADARQVGRFAALPVAAQTAEVLAVQARVASGNASDADLAQLQRLTTVVRTQQADLTRNGLGRAVQDGIVDALPVFDPAQPESINARIAAAQTATAHYGRPVSPLMEAETTALVDRFTAANPEQRLGIVNALQQVNDPAIRRELIQSVERGRRDEGGMPAGGMALVMQIQRSGAGGDRLAQRIMGELQAPVDARVRQAGESSQLTAALNAAMASPALAAVRAQEQLVGTGAFGELFNRDMRFVRDLAARRMAAGATPDDAVTSALRDVTGHMAVLNDSNLAQIRMPRELMPDVQVMREGFRLLRTQAAASVEVGPNATAEQSLAAEQRRQATGRGTWINEGDRFSLITRTPRGDVAVLATATLADVQAAVRVARLPAPLLPTPEEVATRRLETSRDDNARRMREAETAARGRAASRPPAAPATAAPPTVTLE